MKKSTNQSDTNKNTKKSDSNQSSRSLAQSQSPIDETVTENSQKKAKMMKDTMKDHKDEDVGHPCQDCLIININPNLTMHVCSVINQYMYLCGHCGESTNVRLKSFETVSQKITQKSTLKSSQKSTPHKPPQNKPTAAGTPNTTTSKSRLRSKSSDMDTSSDQKEDAEEETSQAQDNNGKTCPECNGSWENPPESTSNHSNNQADKRARSDHDTTDDSTENPSTSFRRLRNSKTTPPENEIQQNKSSQNSPQTDNKSANTTPSSPNRKRTRVK